MLNRRVVSPGNARVSGFTSRIANRLGKLDIQSWLKIGLGLLVVTTCALPAIFRTHPAVVKESPSGKEAAITLSEQGQKQIRGGYDRLPLSFEANRGQADGRVRFLSRGRGYGLFLTPTSAVLALRKGDKSSGSPRQAIEPTLKTTAMCTKGFLARSARSADLSYTTLRMNLLGANASPHAEALAQLPGTSNYFIGGDPKQWLANVPTYAKVKFHDVYPGVDLVYYGNQQQLEHDFVVAPGTHPSSITMGFKGARKVSIDKDGDLCVSIGQGEVLLKRPVAYQESSGVRSEILGKYVLKGPNRVGFEVARYDVSKPLVIDPILVYASYLGGSSADRALAIAVDSAGSAYVTGWTFSANFPVTAGAFQATLVGACRPGCSFNQDAFVSKVSADGSALVYSTYLGGHGFGDAAYSITVDAAGSAYVTGTTTAADFPITPGAFQTGRRGSFVTKLNAAGSALVYSTYLGGSGNDNAASIAVDAAGSAYVTGTAQSTDFPTTPGAFQTTLRGTSNAFVTKISADGSSLAYSTYLGGSNTVNGTGIAVDSAGAAYVTGNTTSSDFPTTPAAFQTTFGGAFDAFVTKMSADGSALAYSTYLGGSQNDSGQGIAVDSTGSAYVTGFTLSADFPVTPGAFQTTYGGQGGSFFTVGDAFVSKLNAGGSGLVYSTYLGGAGSDGGSGIAVDSVGSAYVTGGTTSSNFPITSSAITGSCFSPADGGGTCQAAFVTKLNATGSSLVFSTYFGHNDRGFGVSVDSAGSVYVAGSTGASPPPVIPTTTGSFQRAFGGGNEDLGFYDGFGAKITDVILIAIDIMPGQDPAIINPQSRGNVPVAILSSATFNATTQVDTSSLTLGSTGNESSLAFCNSSGEDVNGDGLLDLVCHFNTQQAGFKSTDTMGVLKGRTVSGTLIQGSDTVVISN